MNHKIYADVAGFDYRFELGPFADLKHHFFIKVRTIRNLLPRYDWVVWLDDDAFVTDFDRDVFREQIASADATGAFVVVADSPVNARGQWTAINAGVVLVRNCPEAIDWLRAVEEVPLAEVQRWWDADRFGKYCFGDQDAMVWALETMDLWGKALVVPHEVLNARPWEYDASPSDKFVCHFPGVLDKRVAIHRLATMFHRDDSLAPTELLGRYGLTPQPLMSARAMRAIESKIKLQSRMPRLRSAS